MKTENQLEALKIIVGYIEQYAEYEPYKNKLLPSRVLHDAVLSAGNHCLDLTQLQAIDVVVSALVETDLFSEGSSLLSDEQTVVFFDCRTIFQALYLVSHANEVEPFSIDIIDCNKKRLRIAYPRPIPPQYLFISEQEADLRFAYHLPEIEPIQYAPIKAVSIREEIHETVGGDLQILRTFSLHAKEITFVKTLTFELNYPRKK